MFFRKSSSWRENVKHRKFVYSIRHHFEPQYEILLLRNPCTQIPRADQNSIWNPTFCFVEWWIFRIVNIDVVVAVVVIFAVIILIKVTKVPIQKTVCCNNWVLNFNRYEGWRGPNKKFLGEVVPELPMCSKETKKRPVLIRVYCVYVWRDDVVGSFQDKQFLGALKEQIKVKWNKPYKVSFFPTKSVWANMRKT